MDIKSTITKYNIIEVNGGKIRCDMRAQTDGVWNDIVNHKQEILAELRAQAAATAARAKRRQDAIDAIEGIAEIKSATRDLAAWNREFEKSFDDCGGLGVRPMPKYDLDAMRKRYPRAAAYLKAENEANKTNCEISEIGKKALEEVIFGDYEIAMERMQKDIDAFVARHIFD